MLIWLNGPFGVGKTETARALQALLPGSHLVDPEVLGFMLRHLTPPEVMPTDFQDHPLWPGMVCDLLADLAARFTGPLIVPMTLVSPLSFDTVVGGLRRSGVALHHFSLLAPPEVILGRLAGRGDGPQSWPAQQLRRCLTALVSPPFGEGLETAGRSPAEVAGLVLAGLHTSGPAPTPLPVLR